MVFRFFKLNPLNRTLISRISSYTNNNPNNRYPHRSPVLIQALNSPFYDYPITNPENPSFNFPKRWHMGHSGHHHHHHHHHEQSTDEGEKIFRLGLAADITLATGKAVTGYLSGSTAIIADAAHSLSDVVLSAVALLSFKASRVPKDKEHPYGHGKFETLGALGISGVLVATAGGIAWHALDVLVGVLSAAPDIVSQSAAHQHVHSHHNGAHHHGMDMDHPVLALNMTIVAIAVKEGLYWITKRAGERTGSGLMKANAWHHRVDAISSVVALLGVGGSILGVKFLDPLAGLVVSGMILKAGVETGYQSILELVDAAIPSHQLEPIKQTIRQVEGVEGCNHLRGRRAGSSLYLDVSIEVDPVSSISTAHEVGESVRKQIQKSHPEVSEVFIHLEPSKLHFPSAIKPPEENTKETGFDAVTSTHKDNEEIISNLLADKFAEKMVIESIKRHVLQDKVMLQIMASIPPDTSLREAKRIEEEAGELILEVFQATSDTIQVCLEFQVGDKVVRFHEPRGTLS